MKMMLLVALIYVLKLQEIQAFSQALTSCDNFGCSIYPLPCPSGSVQLPKNLLAKVLAGDACCCPTNDNHGQKCLLAGCQCELSPDSDKCPAGKEPTSVDENQDCPVNKVIPTCCCDPATPTPEPAPPTPEPVDFCVPNPCHNRGECMHTPDNSFVCKCKPGFDGRLCQNRVCVCLNGGMCTQSGICTCPTPWYGDKCQFRKK